MNNDIVKSDQPNNTIYTCMVVVNDVAATADDDHGAGVSVWIERNLVIKCSYMTAHWYSVNKSF